MQLTAKSNTAKSRGALAAILFLGLACLAAAGHAPAAKATQLAQAASSTQAIYTRGIQKELLAHGYRPGPPDGIGGTRTRAAIRAYQADAGLTVDGAPSKRLLDHLKFALPKVYAFGQPVTGSVLDVQRELADRDYYLGPHDGIAGPATRRAVRWFQEDAGLIIDPAIDSRLLQQIRDADPGITADSSF